MVVFQRLVINSINTVDECRILGWKKIRVSQYNKISCSFGDLGDPEGKQSTVI